MKINSTEAVEWLVKAISNGDCPGSLCAQGYCYEVGCGITQDLDKAQDFFTMAAKQKYIPAMSELAYVLIKKAVTPTTKDETLLITQWH